VKYIKTSIRDNLRKHVIRSNTANILLSVILPKPGDFPDGTEFYIKEFDVPLELTPDNKWFNWSGGKPKPYDVKFLKPDNNWLADSFVEWLKIVEESV